MIVSTRYASRSIFCVFSGGKAWEKFMVRRDTGIFCFLDDKNE